MSKSGQLLQDRPIFLKLDKNYPYNGEDITMELASKIALSITEFGENEASIFQKIINNYKNSKDFEI